MSVTTPSEIRSGINNGEQFVVFELSAISRDRAETKSRRFARVKGFDPATVEEVNEAGSGSIPGTKKYRVRVVSPR